MEVILGSICEYRGKNPVPIINRLDKNNAIFQQDNGDIHTSKLTKDSLKQKKKQMEVLDWPTKSPHLNPRKNMCGLLLISVYKNKRQFEHRENLNVCIKQNWK